MIKNGFFLEQAENIRQEILNYMTHEGNYSKIPSYYFSTKTENMTKMTFSDLYKGNAGVALFLSEMQKLEKNDQDIVVIERLMNYVELSFSKTMPIPSGYYGGYMGIAVVYLRLYLNTENHHYLKQALKFAHRVCDCVVDQHNCSDLMYGLAGSIIGLMQVHSATNDEKILRTIDKLIPQLIGYCNVNKGGVYGWGRNFNHGADLAGLSHGASGVALCFLELAYYFDNPDMLDIALKTFEYEKSRYDPDVNRWMDVRFNFFQDYVIEEHKDEMKSGNSEYTYTGMGTNHWCHGGVGIGLARIRALRLINTRFLKTDLKNAIDSMLDDWNKRENWINFCLCHGAAGKGELLIEYYKYTGEEKWYNHAVKFAEYGLERTKSSKGSWAWSNIPKDYTMMVGGAGVGSFFLRLAAPDEYDSILLPSLKQKCKNSQKVRSIYPNIGASVNELALLFLKNFFPDSIQEIKQNSSFNDWKKLWDISISEKDDLRDMNALYKHEALHSIYNREKKALKLSLKYDNPAFLFIKEKIFDDQINKEKAPFDKWKIELSSFVELFDTESENSEEAYLFHSRSSGFESRKISQNTYFILSFFQKRGTPENLIEFIKSEGHELLDEHIKGIYDQIRDALNANILILND